MLTWRELPHLHQLASMLPGHSSSSCFFFFFFFFFFYLDGFDKPKSNHPSQGVPHATTSDKPPIATAKAVDSDASDRGSDPKTGAITSRAGSFVWHAPGFGVHGNQKQTHEDLNGESGKSVMELK